MQSLIPKNLKTLNIQQHFISLSKISMAKKEMSLIQYYVPQDQDEPDTPNVFALPIAKHNLKLYHIYQHFPLKGTYTYRFKFAHQGFIVWLDLSDPQSKIPLFKDKVCIKANRLSWNQLKLPTQKHTSIPQSTKKQDFSILDHHDSPKQSKNQQIPSKIHEQNLLGGINQHKTVLSKEQTPFNLFQMGGKTSQGQQKKTHPNLMSGFGNTGDLI